MGKRKVIFSVDLLQLAAGFLILMLCYRGYFPWYLFVYYILTNIKGFVVSYPGKENS